MKVLLVEDNQMMGSLIQKMLKLKHYNVDWLKNSDDVMDYMAQTSYDLLLVDWMLPTKSGIEVIEAVRNHNHQVPIIMLTAKSQTADKVTGLTAGADDYLTKPFEFEELEARILSVMRRSKVIESKEKQLGNVVYDYQKQQFSINHQVIDLTQKEYQLLELLMLNSMVSRDLIIDKVWNIDQVVTSNNVDALIKLLRKKLIAVGANLEIKSKRGVGYQLEVTR